MMTQDVPANIESRTGLVESAFARPWLFNTDTGFNKPKKRQTPDFQKIFRGKRPAKTGNLKTVGQFINCFA